MDKNTQKSLDALAKLDTSIDGAVKRIQSEVQGFKNQILMLQSGAGDDPTLKGAINNTMSRIDALDPTSSVTLKV